MSDSSSPWITSLTLGSVGIAAVGVVALGLLQSDPVSRKILSPESLYAKRRASYRYRWQQALQRATLQIQYCFAGGVNEYKAEKELLQTQLLTNEDEITDFIVSILLRNTADLRIGRLEKAEDASKEVYLWLYDELQIYQLPLTTFGRLLADALDRKISRTTFCFVADASAGQASELIIDLIQATNSKVLVIGQPMWMVALAELVEQRVVATAMVERVLKGLCRLEALRTDQEDTVLMTLSQAIVPILLPLLQAVFPDDRHVFGYIGCVPTVQYAHELRRSAPRAVVPTDMRDALQFANPVCWTTPLTRSSLAQSTTVMEPFVAATAALPVHLADTTETWMAAVDAFFRLKDDEKTNNYLPYVFRLDYIMQDGALEYSSDRYWAVCSLLQYVTGTRSRPVSEETIDAAISWLRDNVPPLSRPCTITADNIKAIENCVFQHKQILIANKTLMDTVQPKQHWTLKAAAKRGCACCLPEEDDDEDDEMTSKPDMSLPGAFANVMTTNATATKSSKYVDGKTAFAFDPTKFS